MERVAFAGADQQHIQLGATFDAKVVKVHAMFGQEKDQRILGPRLFGVTGGQRRDQLDGRRDGASRPGRDHCLLRESQCRQPHHHRSDRWPA
jgi:hypothetical protein